MAIATEETLEVMFGPIIDAAMGRKDWSQVALAERLAQLELQLDSEGWLEIGGGSQREFSRGAITTICQLARLYYLKNPLIQRGVRIQAAYVFGQGMNLTAEDPAVEQVIKDFRRDARNRRELTSHQAMLVKEVELQLFGNLFLVMFTSQKTGRVVVRSIPVDEIQEIVSDPDDAKTPRLYKRMWMQQTMDAAGNLNTEARQAWYPDLFYRPKAKPEQISGTDVMWESPVHHIKVGGLSDMRFGISEVYAALDWAKAYKNFLEDWASIVRAYSRFAWRLSLKGKTGGVASAKSKLDTTAAAAVGGGATPPIAASTFISGEGVDLQPVRTAGATTRAEDGRRLLLMVAAVMGLPESFYGDVSVGTLATAKSLDRPTELRFRNRQSLWSDVYMDIISYQIEQAVRAKVLKGKVDEDEDGTPIVTLRGGKDPSVQATFPPILEHDIDKAVGAIVKAATLGGAGMLAGTLDMQSVTRMLLTALGERDVDMIMAKMYPARQPGEPEGDSDEELAQAMEEFKEAIAEFTEGLHAGVAADPANS